MLAHDFDLKHLSLPPDRLCPPVPVRWNYIRWIQELLDTTSNTYTDIPQPEREVVGLDIGVGASCIYALLACASRPNWRMLGTDIDQHSLEYANENVQGNGLEARIQLSLNSVDASLLPQDTKLDFAMTNPPFYDSPDEMKESYINKAAPPSAVCTGSQNEMICPGGDLGFATRILAESLVLRKQIQWYTVMLGRLSSLQQFVTKLKKHDISNFAVTNLVAGHKTKRWAVAWSFGDLRPRNDVARHGELVQAVLPQVVAQTIKVPLMSAQWAAGKMNEMLGTLDVQWVWRADASTGMLETSENVWSRSARRKKERNGVATAQDRAGDQDNGHGNAENEKPDGKDIALAVQVTCGFEQVDLRWLRGHDFVLFQSFCGYLKRGLCEKK
nr:putative methyltransferase-like protein c27d7.08c [Quercus suber]